MLVNKLSAQEPKAKEDRGVESETEETDPGESCDEALDGRAGGDDR